MTLRITARGATFVFGMGLYAVGLLAFAARRQYGFRFGLANLFYPLARCSAWALIGGAALAVIAGGVMVLNASRRTRRRVVAGWGVMLAAAVLCALPMLTRMLR